jgi:hypothetical protein
MFQRTLIVACFGVAPTLFGCESSTATSASASASATVKGSSPTGSAGSAKPAASTAAANTAAAWSPPPLAPAPAGPLKIEVEGKAHELSQGRVTKDVANGQLVILLATKPFPCAGSDPQDAFSISFPVPKGLGGKYPIGTPLAVRATPAVPAGETLKSWDWAKGATLTLADVPNEVGKKLRGALQLDIRAADGSGVAKGAGAFEIEVCTAAADPAPALPELTTQALQGSVGGKPFDAKTILARKGPSALGAEIQSFFFFAEDANCQAIMDVFSGRRAALAVDVGGLNETQRLEGAPQIGSVTLYKHEGGDRVTYDASQALTYVEVERLVFDTGKTIRARIASASAAEPKPPVEHQLSGAFEAKICE